MASTTQKRAWWADWLCNPARMTRVAFPGDGREWNLLVADESAPAWETFAGLMRTHGYLFLETAGGSYNCRKIGGTNSWSLHAYGIALDLNPSKNPFGTRRHNFPQGFIDDVLATGLFRWGIDFDDPMHWEIDVAPSAIQLPPEDDMPLSNEDLEAVRQKVWFNADMRDYVTGSDLHAATHLRQARRDAFEARVEVAVVRKLVEKMAPGGAAISQADIDNIAREVVDELRDRLLN